MSNNGPPDPFQRIYLFLSPKTPLKILVNCSYRPSGWLGFEMVVNILIGTAARRDRGFVGVNVIGKKSTSGRACWVLFLRRWMVKEGWVVVQQEQEQEQEQEEGEAVPEGTLGLNHRASCLTGAAVHAVSSGEP